MDPDRVKILHRADRNDVPDPVTHRLKLNLFPPGNALFDKHLMYRRHIKPRLRNHGKLPGIHSNPSARASESECRTHNDGITDALSRRKSLRKRVCDLRWHTWLPDLFHRVAEYLAVLRLHYCPDIRAEKPDAVFLNHPVLRKPESNVQPRLPAKPRKNTVGTLLRYYPLHRFGIQRLKIYLVGKRAVGHYRRRIGVHKHNVDPFVA